VGRRARTLIGPVVAVIATIAVARADPSPACAVRVSGDAEPAAEVRTSLEDRGLSDRGSPDCAPLTARVVRRGDGLRVEVVDGYGRRSRRDVRDAATAVALIESWVRPEVFDGALPGAAPADGPIDRVSSAGVASSRARPAPAGMAVVLGAAVGGDRATWGRGAVAACGSLGPICLGGSLELARDTRTTGPGFHPRSIATVAVTAAIGHRLGSFAVIAGVAAGPSVSSAGGNGPHMDQTIDTTCLRAGGRLAVSRAFAGAWSVELAVTGDGAVIGTGPGLIGGGLSLRRGWR